VLLLCRFSCVAKTGNKLKAKDNTKYMAQFLKKNTNLYCEERRGPPMFNPKSNRRHPASLGVDSAVCIFRAGLEAAVLHVSGSYFLTCLINELYILVFKCLRFDYRQRAVCEENSKRIGHGWRTKFYCNYYLIAHTFCSRLLKL